MIINNLRLVNYRNYKMIDIDFNDTLNIFIGKNAQGKTNILESIFVLSFTKSYLNIKDYYLIKNETNFFKIEAKCTSNYVNKYEIYFDKNYKKLKINNKEIKKYSDYVSGLKVVIFSPYNVNFIKDGPSIRRKEINMSISQIDNSYLKSLQEYNALLKKRNQFLKSGLVSSVYNDFFFENLNSRFCLLACNIINKRDEYIKKVNNYLSKIFEDITGEKNLKLIYSCMFSLLDINKMSEKFLSKLNSLKEKEKIYGATLIGPHRDDFVFMLGDKDLFIYGSQGQIRAAILSLKLADLFIIKEETNDYPILLLDDIFSELDLEKREKVLSFLKRDVQTIITTTDVNLIDKDLINKAKIFEVNNGNVITYERKCNCE